jgi:ABC-2 type transport system ATP-binding protein
VTVRYRGIDPDWSELGAVELVDKGDGEARLLVEQGIDLEATIGALQRSTELISFSYEPPTLSELFRQAVAA